MLKYMLKIWMPIGYYESIYPCASLNAEEYKTMKWAVNWTNDTFFFFFPFDSASSLLV